MSNKIELACICCDKKYAYDRDSARCDCGELLEVRLLKPPTIDLLPEFDTRMSSRENIDRSGVWRYRDFHLDGLPEKDLVTRGEGNTNLYQSVSLSDYTGVEQLYIKHEGENPTGSFKDRGMTAAASMAKHFGFRAVACASTGNTSASMASYAAVAGLKPLVFIPEGKIAQGKLCQAIAFGAHTIQIQGNFDDAFTMVQQLSKDLGIYFMNSINPYRIEGQKAIFIEALHQLNWQVPDWFILPGGNLGNSSALSKAVLELYEWGIIDRLPRIAVIQAEGANPFYRLWKDKLDVLEPMQPETIATAIRIGNPISWKKILKGIQRTNGCIDQLTEMEIMQAKLQVDRSGIGAEPASCCSIGGLKKLVKQGVIKKADKVVAILTGNLMKDPEAVMHVHSRQDIAPNMPVKVDDNYKNIRKLIEKLLD